MRRYLAAGVLFAVAVGLLALSGRGEAQGNQWTTIKGRVVWGGTKIPEPKRITVTVDKDHCLSANKTAAKDGTILDETLLVNPKTKDLKAQKLPLPLECNIHGWMRGRLLVVNHPYFAITDEDGNFEIKDAPVGKYKIMIYHETIGYRLGAKGKNGEEYDLKPGVTDLK